MFLKNSSVYGTRRPSILFWMEKKRDILCVPPPSQANASPPKLFKVNTARLDLSLGDAQWSYIRQGELGSRCSCWNIQFRFKMRPKPLREYGCSGASYFTGCQETVTLCLLVVVEKLLKQITTRLTSQVFCGKTGLTHLWSVKHLQRIQTSIIRHPGEGKCEQWVCFSAKALWKNSLLTANMLVYERVSKQTKKNCSPFAGFIYFGCKVKL